MIEILVSPDLFPGVSGLSWHGLFSFIAVATAVFLVGRWARLDGVYPDSIYSIAVWCIFGGVLGARLFHVVDRWDLYSNTPWEAFAFWNPGIAVWGGIIGGFVGGAVSAMVMEWFGKRKWDKKQDDIPEKQRQPYTPAFPVGLIADLTAPALLFVQTVGRIGDIVNGEHCAKPTDFFLGFEWTATDTIARSCSSGYLSSVHPAIAYEMLLMLGGLWVIWKLRGRLKPPGMLFALYLAIYSLIRFSVMFLREEKVWAGGMYEAQWIGIGVLVITGVILLAKARPTERVERALVAVVERGTRAERRRRRS